MNSISVNISYIIYTLLNWGFLTLGLRLIHKYLHLSTNNCGLYKKQFTSPSNYYPSHQAQELRKNDERNIVTGIRFWHPAPKSSHPLNFLWKSATQLVHIWEECARCCRSRPAVPQLIMAEKWTRIPNKQNMSTGLYQHLTGSKPNLFRNAVQVRIIQNCYVAWELRTLSKLRYVFSGLVGVNISWSCSQFANWAGDWTFVSFIGSLAQKVLGC